MTGQQENEMSRLIKLILIGGWTQLQICKMCFDSLFQFYYSKSLTINNIIAFIYFLLG